MIKVEGLSKVYPNSQHPAVDNVSFSIETGKIGCFIGTSGSGKTTILKLINQLLEPTAGCIEINGQDPRSVKVEDWRRNIGYVIQSSGLLPHLTVLENIELLSKVIKADDYKDHSKSEDLLNMVGLDPNVYSSKYPSELSGGQAQRVGIARALRNNPPILLMDEPFGALDPIIRSRLQSEFLEINRKLNKTIIFVTHDLSEAFKMADTVYLMNEGCIIQSGHRDDFLNHPKNEFVKNFISAHLI